MSIIKIYEREFTEGNLGVQERKITFLGIPVYTKRGTTTNNNIIKQLASISINDTSNPIDGKLKSKMGFQVSD